jgi:hypothetical protein
MESISKRVRDVLSLYLSNEMVHDVLSLYSYIIRKVKRGKDGSDRDKNTVG